MLDTPDAPLMCYRISGESFTVLHCTLLYCNVEVWENIKLLLVLMQLQSISLEFKALLHKMSIFLH